MFEAVSFSTQKKKRKKKWKRNSRVKSTLRQNHQPWTIISCTICSKFQQRHVDRSLHNGKSQRLRDGDRILLQMRLKVLRRWAQHTNTAFAGCRRGSLHLEEITMWSGCEKRRRGRVGVMAAHGPTSIATAAAAAVVAAGCCNNCSNSQPEPKRKEIQRKG